MNRLGGVIAAVLTPFDTKLQPCGAAALPYYDSLLHRGCDALNVLGTTGEAMSIGLRARLAFMETVSRGLPGSKLMVGIGASALDDAAELAAAAYEFGFAWLLVIPPFYYRDVSDEGIVRYFDELFKRVPPRPATVVLYNFPRMSGITFHPDLVWRLTREFPGALAGVKDSSNTVDLETAIVERCPDLAVFPGSEGLLSQARGGGLAGCISGSVCLWPELAARVWERGDSTDAQHVANLRAALPATDLIGAVRKQVALELSDPNWLRGIPPLGCGDFS